MGSIRRIGMLCGRRWHIERQRTMLLLHEEKRFSWGKGGGIVFWELARDSRFQFPLHRIILREWRIHPELGLWGLQRFGSREVG